MGPGRDRDPGGAHRRTDGRLTGEKSFVIDGSIAGLVLVVAQAPAGPALFAVR